MHAGRSSRPAVSPSFARLAVGCLVLACLTLASCGFQLRGNTAALADTTGTVFVDADREVTIGKPLKMALQERDFRTVDNRDEADVTLRLQDERISERIVSIEQTGRVSEIELSHSVSLLIARIERGESGRSSVNDAARANRVDVIREYTYDEKGVLGKEQEATILRGEMADELVRQVLLRTIASLSSVR